MDSTDRQDFQELRFNLPKSIKYLKFLELNPLLISLLRENIKSARNVSYSEFCDAIENNIYHLKKNKQQITNFIDLEKLVTLTLLRLS